MHEMQTIVTDLSDLCPSFCLSRGSTVCGTFVRLLCNQFSLLLVYGYTSQKYTLVHIGLQVKINFTAIKKPRNAGGPPFIMRQSGMQQI